MPDVATAGRTVMVVEDDEDSRSILTEILESQDYRVVAAANGVEALDLLRAGESPGVILLDLMLPVMNGWEFCEQRSKDAALSGIPVVVCSAVHGLSDTAQALGAADYMTKPVGVRTLLDTIARFF